MRGVSGSSARTPTNSPDDKAARFAVEIASFNCGQDIRSGLKGTLSDFACRLFGCGSEEVIGDVARYRF